MSNNELTAEIRITGPGFTDRFTTAAAIHDQTTGQDMAIYLGDAVEQLNAKARRSLGLPPITGLPPVVDSSDWDLSTEAERDVSEAHDAAAADVMVSLADTEPNDSAPLTVENRDARKALQRVLSSIKPGRDEIAVDEIMSRVFGALLEFADLPEADDEGEPEAVDPADWPELVDMPGEADTKNAE